LTVARALMRAGQLQHIGQALSPLTGPLYGGLSNKVIHSLIPVVGRLFSTQVPELDDKRRHECRRGTHECFPARSRAKAAMKTKGFALCIRGCARHDGSQ
jgi:hypothetical protein